MNPNELQTPDEMLDRWEGCSCDPSVGWLCECCHDTQVVRELIKDRKVLEFLLGQFSASSLDMGGKHSYRFQYGWPWTHARGPNIRAAVEAAMDEVDRERRDSASDGVTTGGE